MKLNKICSKKPLYPYQNGENKKIMTIQSASKDTGQLKHSYTADGSAKCYSHFGKQFGACL